MSRIDDLIQQHCPNGVEFKPLGSMGKRNKGTPITAARMAALAQAGGPVRVFAGGQTVADVGPEAIPEDHIVRLPSIIVKSRGYIGFTYYEQPFTHKSELWSYSIDDPEVDQKFVYYFLLTQVRKLQEVARSTSVKLPQLGVRDTDSFLIPVPPLAVQREIVRILNHFTELEAALEAELEARQEQSEHIQQGVFATLAGDSVRSVPLAEVGKWFGGGTPSKATASYWTDGTIPWISPKDMGTTTVSDTEDHITDAAVQGSATKLVPAGAIALVVRSSILDHTLPIAYVPVESSLNQDLKAIVTTEGIMPRYLFHVLRAKRSDILRRVRRVGGSVASLDSRKLREFEIPVPSMQEQKQVCQLFDEFDLLVNDLSIGLPAELAARRKQYEYYRDKLLTFKELGA